MTKKIRLNQSKIKEKQHPRPNCPVERHHERSPLSVEAIQVQLLRPKDSVNTFLDIIITKLRRLKKKFDPFGNYSKRVVYQCKFCHKKFAKPTALGGHISKIHKEVGKQFSIDYEEFGKEKKLESILQSRWINSQIYEEEAEEGVKNERSESISMHEDEEIELNSLSHCRR